MDFNGNLIVAGSQEGSPELTNFGSPSSQSENSTASKGTLTWPNGFKIQWDTISVSSDSAANSSLPEAYTGEHLLVICCFASNINDGETQSSLSIRPGTAPLSEVRRKQNSPNTEKITYLSFGFDV